MTQSNSEKADYSLAVRVSQDDILRVAQEYMGDMPLEVAEVVWSELAETQTELPPELAILFAAMTRLVLGIGLAARMKYPNDETEGEKWRTQTIVEAYFSKLMPELVVHGPGQLGDQTELPRDDIEGRNPLEVTGERFTRWSELMREYNVTPVLVIGAPQDGVEDGLYLWSAETLYADQILSYLAQAMNETIREVFDPSNEEEGDPSDELPQ